MIPSYIQLTLIILSVIMATFSELSSKIEQVVFKCLSDPQEDIEDNIRTLLAPLVNNKEALELRKLTLEHVIKKIAMRYLVCSYLFIYSLQLLHLIHYINILYFNIDASA